MVSSELIGAVRRHPVWRDATDWGIRSLLSRARDVTFHPGDEILSSGQPAAAIHLLIEGAVRVYFPGKEPGTDVTVKLFWAPAAFGDAESILRVRWAENVEALTSGRVLIIDAAFYFELMQTEPTVCFRQYWDVARRFGIAIRSERSANLDDLPERLTALFLAYANHFGKPTGKGDGVIIDFPLTQHGVATQVGSNRRSVVRALGDLYAKGLVKRVGRRYQIPSSSRLLAAAGNSVPELSFRSDALPWASRKK